jgi:hypothetical protein
MRMHIKTRLTLTIDPKVSHIAKDFARCQGLSLSALVEKLLSEVSGHKQTHPQRARFSQRWKGKMQLTSARDHRTLRLKVKYNLPS